MDKCIVDRFALVEINDVVQQHGINLWYIGLLHCHGCYVLRLTTVS
jgi:hypothetical protein